MERDLLDVAAGTAQVAHRALQGEVMMSGGLEITIRARWRVERPVQGHEAGVRDDRHDAQATALWPMGAGHDLQGEFRVGAAIDSQQDPHHDTSSGLMG